MTQSHLSAQFDAELGAIANRVLWMGGPVESQVVSAVHALTTFNGEDASEVLQDEERVDEMEVEVDRKSQATTASGGERATDSRAHLGFEREPDASLSALLGRALADATALSAVRHSLVASGDADFEVAASETGLFMLHALGEARGAVGWGGRSPPPASNPDSELAMALTCAGTAVAKVSLNCHDLCRDCLARHHRSLSMRFVVLPLSTAALLAACASSPSVPDGFVADRFVTLSCADGKSFQVRAAEGGKTMRVRAHPGSAELDLQADGRFTGEGYILNLKGEGGISLDHAGKSQGKACKRAA